MVRTGAYGYVQYGYESSFGGNATIDKAFGHRAAVTSWTLTTNKIALAKLGQVEPTTFAYGQQTGTLGVGFVLDDESSHNIFRAIYGAPTGDGDTSSTKKYPATLAQGAAPKTFTGSSFTTEIGFQAEGGNQVRTLKGCVLSSLGISATIGNVVECTADVAYGKEDAISTSFDTSVASPSGKPFTFAHGELVVGNEILAEVQDAEITFTQNSELLYQLGSQQSIAGIKRVLDITGRFRLSLKNTDLANVVLNQLKTGTYTQETNSATVNSPRVYRETLGDNAGDPSSNTPDWDSAPEFKLTSIG